MWEQPKNLNEGQKYKVMDSEKFVHFAVFENGKFINEKFKTEIKKVVRVWQ